MHIVQKILEDNLFRTESYQNDPSLASDKLLSVTTYPCEVGPMLRLLAQRASEASPKERVEILDALENMKLCTRRTHHADLVTYYFLTVEYEETSPEYDVTPDDATEKWQLCHSPTGRYLGQFDTREEAVAYAQAEAKEIEGYRIRLDNASHPWYVHNVKTGEQLGPFNSREEAVKDIRRLKGLER